VEEPVIVPLATGANFGISFFEGHRDPVVVLTFPVQGTNPVQVGMTAEDLESILPIMVGAVIRSRVVTEMITTYPEQREEIVKNLMFRWTGTIVEEQENGS
jgi:hypothetical protein